MSKQDDTLGIEAANLTTNLRTNRTTSSCHQDGLSCNLSTQTRFVETNLLTAQKVCDINFLETTTWLMEPLNDCLNLRHLVTFDA